MASSPSSCSSLSLVDHDDGGRSRRRRPPPPPAVVPKVTRLSELWGEGWRDIKNVHGETPEIDFACSAPFRLLGGEVVSALASCVDKAMHRITTSNRSTFIRGVPEMEALIDWQHLAHTCSHIAGVSLVPHPVRVEWTHVNVQTRPMDRPVDSYHTDYVPFVLVTMLRKAPGDATGSLEVRGLGPVSLAQGESLLLQGAHVVHQANQSEKGLRLSLVTSLIPSCPLRYTDMTRIRYHALPLGEGHEYFTQACSYREARLRAVCDKILSTTTATMGEEEEEDDKKKANKKGDEDAAANKSQLLLLDRAVDEFTRWMAQLDGCRDHRYFKRDVLDLFVRAYHHATTTNNHHHHHHNTATTITNNTHPSSSSTTTTTKGDDDDTSSSHKNKNNKKEEEEALLLLSAVSVVVVVDDAASGRGDEEGEQEGVGVVEEEQLQKEEEL